MDSDLRGVSIACRHIAERHRAATGRAAAVPGGFGGGSSSNQFGRAAEKSSVAGGRSGQCNRGDWRAEVDAASRATTTTATAKVEIPGQLSSSISREKIWNAGAARREYLGRHGQQVYQLCPQSIHLILASPAGLYMYTRICYLLFLVWITCKDPIKRIGTVPFCIDR